MFKYSVIVYSRSPEHINVCTGRGGPSAWPGPSHSPGVLRGCRTDGLDWADQGKALQPWAQAAASTGPQSRWGLRLPEVRASQLLFGWRDVCPN